MPTLPERLRRRMQDAVAQAAAAPRIQEAAGRLMPLFERIDWLAALADDWIAPMRVDPAATPTLPAARNGPIITVTLAETHPVRLMLSLIEGRAESAGEASAAPDGRRSMAFAGTYGLYRLLSARPVPVLRGETQLGASRCATRPALLRPGHWFALDEHVEALRIAPQREPVLLLHARIERRPALPVRRFALDTGKLIGTVQADQGFARSAMLLSVLRAAGAREAFPAMSALLDRPSGRERWTVMRELIALDARAAWPHLEAMAAHDPDDSVRHAAAAVLRRHARTAEAEPCPA